MTWMPEKAPHLYTLEEFCQTPLYKKYRKKEKERNNIVIPDEIFFTQIGRDVLSEMWRVAGEIKGDREQANYPMMTPEELGFLFERKM